MIPAKRTAGTHERKHDETDHSLAPDDLGGGAGTVSGKITDEVTGDPERDAGYVYGPAALGMFTIGLEVGI